MSTPFPPNTAHYGDAKTILQAMVDAGVRVQTCITSPPYFSLRSYLPSTHPDKHKEMGAEQTPAEYIANLTSIFSLVRELLSPDGNLFVNIADSRNGSGGSGGDYGPGGKREGQPKFKGAKVPGLKPKDLIGIPWMLAFALRDSGWWLRADNIWAKGVSGQKEMVQQVFNACITEGLSQEKTNDIIAHLNPYIGNGRIEAVKDRTTTSHEYFFHFTKSQHYFYDHEAIAEPMLEYSLARYQRAIDNHEVFDESRHKNIDPKLSQTPMKILTQGAKRAVERKTRNRRSVWCIPTSNFYGAHFAVYPTTLISPLILATSQPGDTVFDPFLGSGTTAQAAQQLGRNWLGIELNPEYKPLIDKRTAQPSLQFG